MSLASQLSTLGVRDGDLLLVHTSFRAVGPIEGGPEALIEALRAAVGARGTIVMPTMTDGETLFDPKTTPTSQMGIVAETFWRLPGVSRSTHPGGSFAAVGPLAARICAEQPLEPPHGFVSPPGRVYELAGKILLIGVDHSESTVLHVAEAIAKVPYSIAYPCVVGGTPGALVTEPIRETDHCCRGFRRADTWLSVERGKVGKADAKLYSARDAVEGAVERLRVEPLFFLCAASEGCDECNAARASIASG